MALTKESCIPCRTGEGKLNQAEIDELFPSLKNWQVRGNTLFKRYDFSDFVKALALVNKIGDLAEAEGHHPDLALGWGYVEITLLTHKADGLTRSDFILAAKIDELA